MSSSFNFIPTTLTDDATDLVSGVELPLFKELAYGFEPHFDLSDFTVVGSPTITDDGIVNNYNASNYLAGTNASDFYQKSWTVETVFEYQVRANSTSIFAFDSQIAYGGIGMSIVSGISMHGRFGDSTTEFTNVIKFPTFLTKATVGNRYKVIWSFDYHTGVYTLSYKGLDDNITDTGTYIPTTTDKQIRSIYTQSSARIRCAGGTGWSGVLPIYLKQFSITVDGQEVFNCYKTGQLLTRGGKYYYVTGNEALKVWIWKVLYTSRFTYLAYTTNYGNELYTLFGRYIRGDVLYSEIKRMIEEALLCNPYITFLSDFKVERQGAKVVCTFGVNTIYGTIAQSYIYEE